MLQDPEVEATEDYVDPDLAELVDHNEYYTGGRQYQMAPQRQYSTHGTGLSTGATSKPNVNKSYTAATYLPGRPPKPSWGGSNAPANAVYAQSHPEFKHNPYMNFVNSTWIF